MNVNQDKSKEIYIKSTDNQLKIIVNQKKLTEINRKSTKNQRKSR